MLQSYIFMFSRTISKDYRWIYNAECITADDKDQLVNDFYTLKQDQSIHGKKYLFVRKFNHSIALFGFSKSKNLDENSRPIYALTGLVFSGLDAQVFIYLFHFIVSALFFYSNGLFDCDSLKKTDNVNNLQLKKDFSIDEFIQLCRTDNRVFSFMRAFNRNLVYKNGILYISQQLSDKEHNSFDSYKSFTDNFLFIQENGNSSQHDNDNKFCFLKKVFRLPILSNHVDDYKCGPKTQIKKEK